MLIKLGIYDFKQKGQPANFKLAGSELRVFDAEGNFLWLHDFKNKLSEVNYNNNFCHNIVIKDIDHDSKKDIIFGSFEDSDADFSGNVWRFDENGTVIWKGHVGHEKSFGGKIYKDHYRIAHIYISDLNSDGNNEIIQIGYHFHNFPVCLQII